MAYRLHCYMAYTGYEYTYLVRASVGDFRGLGHLNGVWGNVGSCWKHMDISAGLRV